MSTVSASFTATGSGGSITIPRGKSVSYSVSGTFVATIVLEKSTNGGQTWETVKTVTAADSGTIKVYDQKTAFRYTCSAFTSGTAVTSLADDNTETLAEYKNNAGETVLRVRESTVDAIRTNQTHIIPTNIGKVGGTAGFVVAATNELSLVTLPASQTGSKLIVPITGLKVGSTITGYYLIGQIESAANTVTLDADLRNHTAAAGDVADASIGAMTQISVTEDTLVNSSNSTKDSLSETITENDSYYIEITGTTGASTDIALQAVAVTVTEA